jgi:hypothetical protein
MSCYEFASDASIFADAGATENSFGSSLLMGDPYCEGPTTRSVVLTSSSRIGFSSCLSEEAVSVIDFASDLSCKVLEHHQIDGQCDSDARTESFATGDVPPHIPQDPFFFLLPTSVYLRAKSPHDLGNDLLAFLHEELSATSVQVRRAEFTVKAKFWHDGKHCGVKLHAYQCGSGFIAVELQRRTSDCVALMGIFHSMVRFLEQRYQRAEKPSVATVFSASPGN